MSSERKKLATKKKLDRKHAQKRPGEMSKYAIKHNRMLGGWDNPRSPIRITERLVLETPKYEGRRHLSARGGRS